MPHIKSSFFEEEGETRRQREGETKHGIRRLSPHLLVSCLKRVQQKASGTLQGFLAPQKLWLCSPRPACAHPSPGGFAGALAGGGAPGRHPLIYRFSELQIVDCK